MTTLSRVSIPDPQTKFASCLNRSFANSKGDNLAASITLQLDFDGKRQYSSPCRLRASSFSFRLGHAQGKTTLGCFLTLSRRFTTHSRAGMRTRSANRVCELLKPKLHQIVKGTTLRCPLLFLSLYNRILPFWQYSYDLRLESELSDLRSWNANQIHTR
jgi:hypothetical protein